MSSDDSDISLQGPVSVQIKADATSAVDQGMQAVVSFVDRVVLPPAESLSRLVADVIDCVRGPFQSLRLTQLKRLGTRVKELREVQRVGAPKALSPKAIHTIVEDGSFVDDDQLRERWAQLIVNAQSGMPINDYLYFVLGKLDSSDIALLCVAGERELGWAEDASRLLSLGLVTKEYEVRVAVEPVEVVSDQRGDGYEHHKTRVEQDFSGYLIAPLGEELLAAVSAPGADADK